MNKKRNKTAIIFCMLQGIIILLFCTNVRAVSVKETFKDVYLTFQVWQGSGTSSVSIGDDFLTKDKGIVKFDEFEELQCNEKVVDISNYTIEELNGNTIIILKEEYLKSLTDGTYSFNAVFSRAIIPVKLHVVTHKDSIKEVKVKKPAKVKKVRAISKKKKLAVKWKKQKNVTGYIIKIGTNKKITKNTKIVTIKKNKNQVIIRGLKSNKKYYLKVRAYKMVNGKKYWGAWSRTMSKKQIS